MILGFARLKCVGHILFLSHALQYLRYITDTEAGSLRFKRVMAICNATVYFAF